MNVSLVLLLVYSAGLIGLGLWIGRRVRGTSDFFVAGRRLGPGLLFATMLAANIGAGSTVGAASLGYRDGLAGWWWVGSAGIGSLVLAVWIGPRIWGVAKTWDLRTVGDYLELRYGPGVRAAIAAMLWIGTLAILAGQLIAGASILTAIVGLPMWAGCIISGLVMTVYFAAGGLLTSAYVNLVQLVVLLVGLGLALPMVMGGVGGWAGLREASLAVSPGQLDFWHHGASGVVYLAMLGPAFIISPGLLQKIYGARDARTVRIGVGANAVVLLVFAFVPVLLGMVARARHPELPTIDLALPTLLVKDLPAAAGALGLAALFSAEVSSADAILFMLSTSLSQDLYRRFLRPQASDAEVLKVARGAAIAGGTLGVLLAIVSGTIISTLSIFYTLLSVSLFVPILAGLYMRRAGTPEAVAAIGVGVGALIAIQLGTGGSGYAGLTPALIGLVASAAGFAVVLASRRRGRLSASAEAAADK